MPTKKFGFNHGCLETMVKTTRLVGIYRNLQGLVSLLQVSGGDACEVLRSVRGLKGRSEKGGLVVGGGVGPGRVKGGQQSDPGLILKGN